VCCSCGCSTFASDHGDSRHITLTDLQSAATAGDLKLSKVAKNISDAVNAQASKSEWTDDSQTAACSIFKSVEESRVTVGLAYPADRPDVSRAADGFRDFAGRSAVERACWTFTAKSRSIGLQHANGTEGHGEVVESGIHRGPDWVIKGDDGQEKVIKDGDWVLAVRWDISTWSAIKSRKLNGFSPQGRAKRGTPTPERVAELRSV
jgi:hypothetical protein